MATQLEWSEGYRQQALADLRAAQEVQGVEPSVFAMLLQMVFEKLGKAALLRTGMLTVAGAQATHQAGTTMMQVLSGNRRKTRRLGYSLETVRDRLTPMVNNLESLNPSVVRRRGGDGPWLEYPWENAQGILLWPARDLPGFEDFRARRAGRAIMFLDLAEVLNSRFDEVFA